MNRCFDPYPFIDVVNKFYGAVCQGLDNNLLGNCVINLCIYSDPVQQVLWRCCRGSKEFSKSIFRRKKEILIWTLLNKNNKNSFQAVVIFSP